MAVKWKTNDTKKCPDHEHDGGHMKKVEGGRGSKLKPYTMCEQDLRVQR